MATTFIANIRRLSLWPHLEFSYAANVRSSAPASSTLWVIFILVKEAIWQLRVVVINYYAKQLPYRGGSFSGLPIGMIAARVVVASDETALAALRKSKIHNVSTEAKR